MTRRAVIVGGGLAGLATALRLASRGWKAVVCEQGETVGGKMNRAVADGFVFDTGPSLITMPWIFEDLFAAAGARLGDHLELVEMQPLARYVFADGASFRHTSAMPEWLATVRDIEPRDVDGFWRFMQLGARIFELSSGTFFRRGPLDRPDLRALKALRHLPLRHGWGNYHATVAAHFRSPYLRQMFDRYPTYVGSSPYLAPATLAVIPYIEFAFGGWYIRGGLYRLVEALRCLAIKAGVALRTSTRIASIDVEGGRTRGVVTAAGERIPGDVVVMNGDPSAVPSMTGGSSGESLAAGERSLSGVVLLAATRSEHTELAHHSVYFSADYEREFDDLFARRQFPADPTVYVNVPSRTDRSVVPGRGDTIFIMANAPATDARHWDDDAIGRAQSAIFERLHRSGFPDLAADVEWHDVWTPARFARQYLAPGGAIYGTHSHGWKHAFLRPPNRDPRIANLFYVGGGTHPGGGTPTVLMSAAIVSDLILRGAAE